MSVEGGHIVGLTDHLGDEGRLIAVYEVTGAFDHVAIGKYADGDELRNQLGRLLADPAVTGAEISPVQTVVGEYDPVELSAEED